MYYKCSRPAKFGRFIVLPVILHFEKDKMSLICPSISEERKENKGTKEKEKLLHDESQQNG